MTKKKRNRLIVWTVILIGALLAYFIRDYIREYNRKWKHIEQTYMADFTGNGKAEMLIIYDDYEKKSAMKLVDIESRKTIWKSYCRPSQINDQSKRIYHTGSMLAIAYYDRQNDTTQNSLHSLIGVEAFNSKTGEKIWDHQLNWKHSLGVYFWLFGHKNRVFVFTNNFNKNLLQEDEQVVKSFITCIDLNTGEEKWQNSVPKYGIKAPDFANDKMILNHSKKLYVIDIEQGKLDTINSEDYHTNVFSMNDSTLYYILGNALYKHDSIPKQVELHNKPVIIENIDSALYIRTTAIYNGSIISIHDTVISSTPFTKQGKSYQTPFEKGHETMYFGIFDVVGQSRKLSPFHRIENRFIPVLLYKKEDNVRNEKLGVYDLDLGEFTWKSKALPKGTLYNLHKHVLNYKGFYLFNIDKDNGAPDYYLLLNGKTGRFHKTVDFSNENTNYIPWFRNGFSLFYENYFYNSYKDVAWCLKYPEMEVVYSTKRNLKTVDAKDAVESMLGKMPWDKEEQNNE